MTKLLIRTGGITAVGALLLFAANVKTDYDHESDFSKYRTYSWAKVTATDSLWRDRITEAIDTQLSAKGWNKVESGGDTTIAAFGSTKNQQTISTFYDQLGGFGYGFGRFGRRFGGGFGGPGIGSSTSTVENTPIGVLVVHIYDAQTKKLVWTGSSTDTLSEKPDKNEKKLEKDTAEMFKKFPPNEKG